MYSAVKMDAATFHIRMKRVRVSTKCEEAHEIVGSKTQTTPTLSHKNSTAKMIVCRYKIHLMLQRGLGSVMVPLALTNMTASCTRQDRSCTAISEKR